MQGLNLTPRHGHTALFGVYGFLGIGLTPFCLRGLKPNVLWDERVLKTCFWACDIGLAGMALLTLLPMGVIQLAAAIDQGYWFAGSAELMQKPIIALPRKTGEGSGGGQLSAHCQSYQRLCNP